MLQRAALCAALATILCGPVLAQEGPDLPKVTILSCEQDCTKWTDPKPKGDHHGSFPAAEQRNRGTKDMAEGYVRVRYTIGVDGHVKSPAIVKLIGPEAFGTAALEAVQTWEYEPATANGVPVERPNWGAIFNYRVYGADNHLAQGARPEVYQTAKKAQELLAQSKYVETDALLVPILSKPRLLLYERATVSLLLSASLSYQKKLYEAREYAEDAATLDWTTAAEKAEAIRQLIRLDAITGHFGEALNWFEILRKSTAVGFSDDDHEAQLVGRINKLLANPDPIVVNGYILPDRPLDTWDHILLRRHFLFPAIKGKLTQFELDCDHNRIVSPITDKAEWHVPKSWSNCNLRVEGDPGTVFHLVEANE